MRRSVPRASALARALDWDTQRQCLDKGHSQAERYGFFCRLTVGKVKAGNRREWTARPFAEAWDDYLWVSGQRSLLSSDMQPFVVGDGVKLRNVIDFRALLLRSLFDAYAEADKKVGERVWRVSLKELCKMLGASEYATQTALNRAGLRKIGQTALGFVMK